MATNDIVTQVVVSLSSQDDVNSVVTQVMAVVASQSDVRSVVTQVVAVVATSNASIGWMRPIERHLEFGKGGPIS